MILNADKSFPSPLSCTVTSCIDVAMETSATLPQLQAQAIQRTLCEEDDAHDDIFPHEDAAPHWF